MKSTKGFRAFLEAYLTAILILAFFSACAGGRSSGPAWGSPGGPAPSQELQERLRAARPASPGPDAATRQRLQAAFARLPLSFIPNRGQVDGQVQFYGNSGPAGFFFTRDEVVYSFVRRPEEVPLQRVSRSASEGNSVPGSKSAAEPESRKGEGVGQDYAPHGAEPWIESRACPGPDPGAGSAPGSIRGPGQAPAGEQVRGQVVRLQFVGATPEPGIEGGEELPGKVNYLIGSDPAQWKRGLPTYGQVRYRELWSGIDLVYRGEGGSLKYELVVKPGADPSRILLAYRGIEGMSLSGAGDLILQTASGELRDSHPVAYQEIGGRRVVVAAGFRVEGRKSTGPEHPLDGRAAHPTSISRFPEGSRHGFELPSAEASPGGPASLPGADEGMGRKGEAGGDAAFVHGFEVKGYDPAYPLILDPGLDYSTFLGGSGEDEGLGIALDGAGNAFVTGWTASTNFPTTPGAFDTSYNGSGDAFVAKLSANGSSLLYSTFLGGSDDGDGGLGIALDGAGNAFVTGGTRSSNFPTTPGAFDTSSNGNTDVFVAKLSTNGSTLLYSTFLGGGEFDKGLGIALDGSGNAFVTGQTTSTNFPTTAGAFDTSFNGGGRDGFVAKLSANGSSLLYSTFLGGSGWDNGYGIALDSAGNAFVTGYTTSTNFPTTAGAFDTGYNGGSDAFVARLSADGSSLLYSTFLGGSSTDTGFGIALDGAGNAFVTGYTYSTNFPTTAGAFDTGYNGSGDAFVARLSANGSFLLYSTFLGGSGEDWGLGIALDSTDNAFVTGWTASTNFPTTPGAFDTGYNGGTDAFVARLSLPELLPTLTLTLTGCNPCKAGDRFALQAWVTNFTSQDVPVEAKIGARLPDGTPVNLLGDRHLETTLTAWMDQTYSILDIEVPPGLPTGGWTIEGTLVEPELGETIGRHSQAFEILAQRLSLAASGGLDRKGLAGEPGSPQTASTDSNGATPQKLQAAFARLPLGFIPNRGQVDERVAFYGQSGPASFFLARDEVVYTFVQREKEASRRKVGRSIPHEDPDRPGEKGRGQVVRLWFVGANPDPVIEGQEERLGRVNHLIGPDPARWKIHLPIYGRVRYRELWPGIDLVYRGEGGRLKYELVVKPGADPSKILLAYRGIEGMRVSDAGDLILRSASGELRDRRPVAYQEIGGRQVAVEAGFRLAGPALPLSPAGTAHPTSVEGSQGGPGRGLASSVQEAYTFIHGFEVKGYDPAYPLILDPGLEYSTFLGGSGDDGSRGIALDGSGNALLTGFTASTNFPTTAGAFDTSYNGFMDGFVAKLSSDGTSLLWATFLGGNDDDWGWGITLDGSGNALVTGFTASTDFPTTAGAYDTSFNGNRDAFVAKLSSDGTQLLYSTFLGGSGVDVGWGITRDSSGNALVTGEAGGSNFPTTPGAYDTSFNGGGRDGFVAKLSSDGTKLLYSTFLGGSSGDVGWAITRDGSGNALVTGRTASSDFPTTPGAFDTSFNGGQDAFAAKLSSDGTQFLYSTFLGGSGDEEGLGVGLDAVGNAWVTGETTSADFPATPGAFDPDHNGGDDAFVARLSSDGSLLLYSTFLGGSGDEVSWALALNSAGNAVVAGESTSSDFPTTAGAFDTGSNGGWDAFVARLSPPTASADLSLAKSGSPNPVLVGRALTYTLTATNHGPDAVSRVQVTDTLPGGVILVSATPGRGSCSGTGPVTCDLGSLASGASATVTIVVRPTAAGELKNAASVTGSEPDPDNANNTVTAVTTAAMPALGLTLTGCTRCRPGDRFIVQGHLTNPISQDLLVEAKVGVRLPDGTRVNLLGKHLETTLPGGMDDTPTLLEITVPDDLPMGRWTAEATLLEPELGETFSRQVVPFEVMP